MHLVSGFSFSFTCFVCRSRICSPQDSPSSLSLLLSAWVKAVHELMRVFAASRLGHGGLSLYAESQATSHTHAKWGEGYNLSGEGK